MNNVLANPLATTEIAKQVRGCWYFKQDTRDQIHDKSDIYGLHARSATTRDKPCISMFKHRELVFVEVVIVPWKEGLRLVIQEKSGENDCRVVRLEYLDGTSGRGWPSWATTMTSFTPEEAQKLYPDFLKSVLAGLEALHQDYIDPKNEQRKEPWDHKNQIPTYLDFAVKTLGKRINNL